MRSLLFRISNGDLYFNPAHSTLSGIENYEAAAQRRRFKLSDYEVGWKARFDHTADPVFSFHLITHQHAKSLLIDSFPKWRHRLQERLV